MGMSSRGGASQTLPQHAPQGPSGARLLWWFLTVAVPLIHTTGDESCFKYHFLLSFSNHEGRFPFLSLRELKN